MVLTGPPPPKSFTPPPEEPAATAESEDAGDDDDAHDDPDIIKASQKVPDDFLNKVTVLGQSPGTRPSGRFHRPG